MMKQRWGLNRNNVLRPTSGDPWGVEQHHWNTGAKESQELNPDGPSNWQNSSDPTQLKPLYTSEQPYWWASAHCISTLVNLCKLWGSVDCLTTLVPQHWRGYVLYLNTGKPLSIVVLRQWWVAHFNVGLSQHRLKCHIGDKIIGNF